MAVLFAGRVNMVRAWCDLSFGSASQPWSSSVSPRGFPTNPVVKVAASDVGLIVLGPPSFVQIRTVQLNVACAWNGVDSPPYGTRILAFDGIFPELHTTEGDGKISTTVTSYAVWTTCFDSMLSA